MEKIRAIGFDPRPGNAETLATVHRAELTSVAATVKAAGIKASKATNGLIVNNGNRRVP